jgi:hypothetical protein
MRLHWLFKIAAVTLVIAGGMVIAGCDDPSVYEPEGPTLPLSNERIISDAVLGAANLGSSIYALYEGDNGSVYFVGRIDDSYGIGNLTRQGALLWWNTMDPRARGLCPVPANNIGLVEGIVSVAAEDTSGDDQTDIGIVRLIGALGADIDELTISSTGAGIWLNSVAAVAPLEFVAVGGAAINDFNYPFIATFGINPDSTLFLKSSAIVDAALGQYFSSVLVDPNRVTGNAFVCYTVGRVPSNSLGVESIAIHALSGSTIDLTTHILEWTVDIERDEPFDLWMYIDAVKLHNGNIYFAGATDVEKEKNPATEGEYWDAGFIGSVSTNGDLNWWKIVSISKHSDDYYDIYVTDEALFASGRYDHYRKTSNDRMYGLAFLSIFDPFTGAEKYHLGLGSNEYDSGFNSTLISGTGAFCAGWTNQVISGEGYQAWFAEVGLEGVPNANFLEIPEMPAAAGAHGEAEAPHPREAGR